MRYFIRLSYKGTHYRGWQRQNESGTVQEVLELALYQMTKSKTGIMGCGRTDVGVHARQFYAHFEIDTPFTFDLVERALRVLPTDIVIHELLPMHVGAHTRFDADDRTYYYYCHTSADPMLSEVSSFINITDWKADLVELGLLSIYRRTDFRYLCLTPDRNVHTRCLLKQTSVVYSADSTRMRFSFKANRFLKSMIRIIMARILDLGMGKITLEEFEGICNGERLLKFNRLAPPNGLHLVDVTYPYFQRKLVRSIIDEGFG